MPFALHHEHSEHPVLELIVECVSARAHRRLAWERAPSSNQLDEQQFYTEQPELALLSERIDDLDLALDSDQGEPFQRLVQIFGLTPQEQVLLLTCLALALEPQLASVYAALNGGSERGYATEDLAARLFGWGRRGLLAASGPLATWGFVHTINLGPGRPPAVVVDPQVRAHLQGQLQLDGELVGVARFIAASDPLPSWPLDRVAQRIARSLEHEQPIRVLVVGSEGCGRRSFAAALAALFRPIALLVDTDEIDEPRWSEQIMRVARLCGIGGVIPIWHGDRVDRRWTSLTAPPLQFIVCEHPDAVSHQAGVVDERVIMPNSNLDERRQLWAQLVPGARTWDQAARERLATRHRLAVGDIAAIGRRLPSSAEQAALMAREQTRGRLGELGLLLECPFEWADLVIADKQREALENFAYEARERANFWDAPANKRLFPRGTGLVALLTGPPGTGKTMAAQVVAAQLDLDLFRINLATVTSKYIGETAKNLDRIFARAARMNAVLLFDEADALFSKRTDIKDSHDRHANTDTNYLLQLLEDYQGIALLASNKKNNIDPAFIRRVRYVLDFGRPDPAQRRTIWRRVLGELLGADALRPLEPAIAVIAMSVDISGAQIKNSVLASLFLARRAQKPVGVEHLLSGVDRELNKEGRALSERDRARMLRHG